MADPATTIQAAADTVAATHSLLTALISFLPTAGYVITAVAAFVPKPGPDTPPILRFAHKAMTYIAFNVKHARNITDDRRKSAEAERPIAQAQQSEAQSQSKSAEEPAHD